MNLYAQFDLCLFDYIFHDSINIEIGFYSAFVSSHYLQFMTSSIARLFSLITSI